MLRISSPKMEDYHLEFFDVASAQLTCFSSHEFLVLEKQKMWKKRLLVAVFLRHFLNFDLDYFKMSESNKS